MAASPNRSSPLAAVRRNPIASITESGRIIRNSFGGFPTAKPSITAPKSFNSVTPANSPSDFPPRNLILGEGIRASYEKENDRDQSNLNLGKTKSLGISKGAKSFMAPTFSAVSKFTPSPRKKLLAERNETNRASPVLDASSGSRKNRSVLGLNPVDFRVVLDTPNILQLLQRPRSPDLNSSFTVSNLPQFSKTENLGIKPVSDSPKMEEFPYKPKTAYFKYIPEMAVDNQQNSSSPRSAETQNPLSLPDSSFPDKSPSYDPETNFLLPRPRFLRYKPNPRIEAYIHKEKKGLKSLDDSLTSESSSDSEIVEEAQSPNPVSSEVKEIDAIEECADMIKTHQKNSHSSIRPKNCMSYLLLLAIICVSISVTDSPVIRSLFSQTHAPESLVLSDRFVSGSFSKFAKFANENLVQVSGNLRARTMNSFLALVRMISNTRGGEMEVFYLMNITVPEDMKGLLVEKDQKILTRIGQGLEMEGEADQLEEDDLLVQYESVDYKPSDSEPGVVEGETGGPKSVEENLSHSEPEALENTNDMSTNEEIDGRIVGRVSKYLTNGNEISEEEELQAESYPISQSNIGLSDEKISTHKSHSGPEHRAPKNQDAIDHSTILFFLFGVSATLLSVVVPASYVYLRKMKGSMWKAYIPEQSLLPKENGTSDSASDNSYSDPMVEEALFRKNSQESSNFAGSLSSTGLGCLEKDESVSQQKKQRRVSNVKTVATTTSESGLAGSPSSGSITTYRRICKVSGEEEAMTPVRRSSRLRKQITSP